MLLLNCRFTMRHVEAKHVHAGINQRGQLSTLGTGWTDRGYDFCP